MFVSASGEICAWRTHRESMLQIIQEETQPVGSGERLTHVVCFFISFHLVQSLSSMCHVCIDTDVASRRWVFV